MFDFLTPTPGGPGFDFYILWNTGYAILSGESPYIVAGAVYPPVTSYLFAILALLPITVSYILWMFVNGIVLVKFARWRSFGWLTFVPLLFVFAAGQVNLVLFSLIFLLPQKGWKAAIAASLLTLKPQLGVIILPWWVLRWLVSERELFAKFLGTSLAIHLAPALIRPSIYSEWFTTIGWGVGHKFGSGIWMLEDQFGLVLVATGAFLLAIWGLTRKDEKLSRIALTLANPVLGYYDTVILMDTTPWWLLGPVSLVALGASHYIGATHAPFVAIPISAFLWRILKNRLSQRENAPPQVNMRPLW